MPFALDLMKLPADMFELFVVTGVYAANISDCLAAMHLMALTLMVACASSETLRLRWKRVSIVLVSAVFLAGILLFGTRVYLAKTFEGSYNKDKVLASMQLLENPVPDSRDIEFASLQSINQLKTLKIGVFSRFRDLLEI